jgi:hypothetical protein
VVEDPDPELRAVKKSGRLAKARLWKCPECSREFAHARQWHSCAVTHVSDHFRGRDSVLRRAYDRLIDRVRDLGPLRVAPVKTCIHLSSRTIFAGVTVKRDALRVAFLTDTPIRHARIIHAEHLGPTRFGQSVLVRSPADVDDQLVKWLAKAYARKGAT